MFGSWLFLLTNCHQVTAGYQNSQYSGFKLICIEHEQTLLSLRNEYKNAVHMSSSADSHFAIEICVIFFLCIFFYFVNIFFLLEFRTQNKKIIQTANKKSNKISHLFLTFFLSFYFLRIFLSHIFFSLSLFIISVLELRFPFIFVLIWY